MNRRASILSAWILIIAVIAMNVGGCSFKKKETPKLQVPVNVPAPVENNMNRNEYSINAVLDSTQNVLTAEQKVEYVNNENVELSELYFHVYTNAFKQEETAPFLFDDFSRAYSNGFQPGFTEFTSVELSKGQDRMSLEYSLQGEGETILKILLPEPLKPQDSIELGFKYKITIPPAGERFGYGEDNINMGNWYPVAAVYDTDGWNLDKYFSVGDPFYSDTSDYDVTIKAPKEYIIAASGALNEEKLDGEYKSWKFTSKNMRDFAFIASDRFKVSEDKVGDIQVKSYYYDGKEQKGKEALEYGKKSLEIFNKTFGEYPYPTYSIVATEFPSGMEYPGLIYINKNYYLADSSRDNLLYTVVHETAHQWWYGVVGNDQIDEAWLDEGFATYSEGVFTEQEYGSENGQLYFKYLKDNASGIMRTQGTKGAIFKTLSGYVSWDDYGPAVYTAGAALLNEIRNQVGDETFFTILQSYYNKYSFKNATTENFLEICEELSGKEFKSLFNNYTTGLN